MANANKIAQEILGLEIVPEIKSGPESVRSIKKFADRAANEIAKVMAKAGKAGFSADYLKDFSTKMKQISQQLVAAKKEGNKEAQEALQEQFLQEKSNLEKLLRRRKEATEFAGGKLTKPEETAKMGETLGKGIGAAFSDVMSGNLGQWSDMFKRWGGRMKKFGFAQEAKETEGSTGRIMGLLGKMMRKLGPMLLIVGAIAAAFTAAVKTAIDADTQMKELAKTLIDAGASAGDMVSTTRSLKSVLAGMAKFAQDQPFNELWGTLPQDQAQLLGAWSEAGFTLKEMRTQIKDAGSDMAAYQKATAAALTYSKLLGESATSVAQGMAERMEDFGLTLEGVRKEYSSIYEAAQLSGFGTKRFFGMVLQATSGMTMFNVRMEEAAGLMLSFTKVLGRKSGEQFFQTMASGFKDMSIQDRVKAVKLMGDQYKEIAAAEMGKAGVSVMGKLAADFGKEFNRGAEALAAFGMEMGMSQSLLKKIAAGGPAARAAQKQLGDILTKSMAKMTPEEYTKALAEVRLHIEDPKVVTEIEKLYRTTRGMSDDIVEQARAAASWGPGGVMAGQIAIAMNKANKPFYEIGKAELMGILGITSMSEDTYEQMVSVYRAASGGFAKLEKLQSSGQKVSHKLNKEMADKYGMALKDGKKYSAILKDGNIIFKDEIDNVQDAVMALGGAVAEIPDAEAEQRKTALEVAQETLTVERRIEQYMKQVLGDISRTVTKISNLLEGNVGLNEAERKNQSEVLKIARAEEQRIAKEMKGKTGEERKALGKERLAATAMRKAVGRVEGSWLPFGWGTKSMGELVEDSLENAFAKAAPESRWFQGGTFIDEQQFARQIETATTMFGKENVEKWLGSIDAAVEKEIDARLTKKEAELKAEGLDPRSGEYAEAMREFEDELYKEGGALDFQRQMWKSELLERMFTDDYKKLLEGAARNILEGTRATRGTRAGSPQDLAEEAKAAAAGGAGGGVTNNTDVRILKVARANSEEIVRKENNQRKAKKAPVGK